MAGASRVGDANSAGGTITRGAGTVFIDGRPAGLHVSGITPHAPWGNQVPHADIQSLAVVAPFFVHE